LARDAYQPDVVCGSWLMAELVIIEAACTREGGSPR
jgi:hypothetical protein